MHNTNKALYNTVHYSLLLDIILSFMGPHPKKRQEK